MFYATTICSDFFPLGSISRAMQLQNNQHITMVSDKYVLIWNTS